MLLQHICPHFWAWLLNTIAITPKSEDKYVVKVFNWSEFHLSETTLLQNQYFSNCICISSILVVMYWKFKCYKFNSKYNMNWNTLINHNVLFSESDCECIKWDQCSWFNDAFKRALEISKVIYQGVLSTGLVQLDLWYKSLWQQYHTVHSAHTAILPDWTLKKWGLSNFAFQHC